MSVCRGLSVWLAWSKKILTFLRFFFLDFGWKCISYLLFYFFSTWSWKTIMFILFSLLSNLQWMSRLKGLAMWVFFVFFFLTILFFLTWKLIIYWSFYFLSNRSWKNIIFLSTFSHPEVRKLLCFYLIKCPLAIIVSILTNEDTLQISNKLVKWPFTTPTIGICHYPL